MSALTVAGGLYHERCIWPEWNRVLGSGGRAAAAVVSHVDHITFRTYASAAPAGAGQTENRSPSLNRSRANDQRRQPVTPSRAAWVRPSTCAT